MSVKRSVLLLGIWIYSAICETTLGSANNEHQIQVQSMKVDCKVTSRFVHSVVTTKALNTANVSQEVMFEVDLPKTSFITNFSMEIEGKIYVGEVKEKEKAKKQYEKAIASGQSAGIVKASGRTMEKFTVSVNIAANSSVIFVLTHEELLQRKFGRYELIIRVKPKQLVQHFEIVADIYEPQGIAFLDAYGTFITNELFHLVEKTVTSKKAHVSFSPTLDQQRTCPDCEGTIIDGDFHIKYDVNRAHDIGDVQIVNGYFVHYFSPTGLPRVPKRVVFVIDKSFSMSGKKIAQTREALLTILSELPEDDYFALIAFSSSFTLWRPELSKATEENVAAAKEFVKTIVEDGGTELYEAMIHGVKMLYENQNATVMPKNTVPMIILLTDGQPNTYPKGIPEIHESIRVAIGGNISVFSLAFGYGADYGFLDTLSKQNNGVARRIYEDSDAPLQLKGFYEEVSSPILTEVHFNYPNNVNSLTRSHFKQLFNGSEILVAGQINDLNTEENFLIEVSAQGIENDFELKGQASAVNWDTIFPEEDYIFGGFTERLWAYLTIQELLDKKDRGSADERDNATATALQLSLKYNFVTPITSMVVTKPETEVPLLADKLTEEQRGPRLGYNLGVHPQAFAFPAIAMAKSSPIYYVDGDPHFILQLPEKNDALCFNIDDNPGTIFNLVEDPLTGIVVNGQTIGDKLVKQGKKLNTYFGKFGIVSKIFNVRLMISTKEIYVIEKGKHANFFWSETATSKSSNMNLHVIKYRSLTVTIGNFATFLIVLHKVWINHPYHQDYLGFYTVDSHQLSPSVHGLLGQFYHGLDFEVSDVFPGKDPEKPDAMMLVKGHEIVVTRGWQRNFKEDVKYGERVPCWFVHNNGTGLLDGSHTDYIVSSLFDSNYEIHNEITAMKNM